MDAKRLNEIEEWYGPGSVAAQLCVALRSLQAEHAATVAALEQANARAEEDHCARIAAESDSEESERERDEARAALASEVQRREEAERAERAAVSLHADACRRASARAEAAERKVEELRGALRDLYLAGAQVAMDLSADRTAFGLNDEGDPEGAVALAAYWAADERARALSGASSPTAPVRRWLSPDEAQAFYAATGFWPVGHHLDRNEKGRGAAWTKWCAEHPAPSEATPTEPAAKRGSGERIEWCLTCGEPAGPACGGGHDVREMAPPPGYEREPAPSPGSGEVLGTCPGESSPHRRCYHDAWKPLAAEERAWRAAWLRYVGPPDITALATPAAERGSALAHDWDPAAQSLNL